MGQYYHAVVLPPKQSKKTEIIAAYNPLRYGMSGSKLMGHSWADDNFVLTVESFFLPGEKFHKHRLVWAGDYADPEKGTDENLYQMAKEKFDPSRFYSVPTIFRYLVNHTKGVYLDNTKQEANSEDERIHPLPLLTCEGNGRGGGDYFTEDGHLLKHIGSWARDIISAEMEIPVGYSEIIVSF